MPLTVLVIVGVLLTELTHGVLHALGVALLIIAVFLLLAALAGEVRGRRFP